MLIAVTPPQCADPTAEAGRIARMLEAGRFDRVHIRKDSEAAAMAVLDRLPARLLGRVSVHNATAAIVERYPAVGVHLTGRTPLPPAGFKGIVSRSCHSVGQLSGNGAAVSYSFISPVADSISKPGYHAAFTDADLRRAAAVPRTIALGGISAANLARVRSLGFAGAAMLGAAWPEPIGPEFALQFISHTNSRFTSPLQAMAEALRGGCRWCQLRMKDADPATRAQAARTAAGMCERYGATLIVDDDVDAVIASGAQGVHLGLNDMPLSKARRLLPGRIIGATANTAAHIVRAWREGADYIGLGPFHFTSTKQRLSPVLGAAGIADAIADARAAGVDIPIVAIGGITRADLPVVFAAGAGGVAVSGAIINAPDPAAETRSIIETIHSTISK